MQRNAPLTCLALAAAFVALAAGPAAAATTVSSQATVWQGPDGVRLIVRIDDDSGGDPGTASQLKVHLPLAVTLDGAGLPRCSAQTIRQSGIEACPDGSQVGSGGITGTFVGGIGATTDFEAFVVNGPAPAGLLIYLELPGTAAKFVFESHVAPSDDAAFDSMVVVPIPIEVQQPVPGVWHALTQVDLVMHGPYVAITGCPLDLKTVVEFNQDSPDAPPVPLATTAAATCLAGPPPALQPMPRAAPQPPPPPPPPPAPLPPAPTATAAAERAVAPFAVHLVRKDGKVRRLRLTGVPAGATVSVRCLRRCGGAGKQLLAARDRDRLRLKERLRRRSRFELSVAQPGLVARFARFRVDRRARTAIVLKAGCRDPKGAERVCPVG